MHLRQRKYNYSFFLQAARDGQCDMCQAVHALLFSTEFNRPSRLPFFFSARIQSTQLCMNFSILSRILLNQYSFFRSASVLLTAKCPASCTHRIIWDCIVLGTTRISLSSYSLNRNPLLIIKTFSGLCSTRSKILLNSASLCYA